MKKLIIPTIILFNFIFTQSQTNIDFNEMLEYYSQITSYEENDLDLSNLTNKRNDKFDYSDYSNEELLTLDSLGVLQFLIDTTEVQQQLKYFGYDYFESPEKVLIFDNIPIPKDYVIGPGDQLILSIWGETQFKSDHLVTRDGNIFVDGIGQIYLSGLTINYAENFLKEKLSDQYSTLIGDNPSTFISLSIGRLKSINISFIGEVASPGMHAIHPFSDIPLALLQVGGVDTVGSLRNIQVIRNGEVLVKFDFYKFLTDGKVNLNTRLTNGDVILVPPRESFVKIEGEVNRPGFYEAKNEDSVSDLIKFAGDFTPKAQQKIELFSLKPISERTSEDYAYEMFYSNMSEIESEPAINITRIRVLTVPNVEREVMVYGKVKLPGVYVYEDSMRVLDLLKITGGLEDHSFFESMYSKEADIIRQTEDSFYPKRIPINLQELIDGQIGQNVTLRNKDLVIIRENSRYIQPKYITLSGEVNIPGKYTIQEKNETLRSVISRAGGFGPNAYENGLRMYRDTAQVVLKGYDMIIANGDSIYVPQTPGTVKIEGEVNKEGLVQYAPGKSLSYYIEKAGGYSNWANKKSVIIQYANGNVRKKKTLIPYLLYWSPPIKDGATINVYAKEKRTPFNTIQLLSSTAQVATSIVTLYILIQNNTN